MSGPPDALPAEPFFGFAKTFPRITMTTNKFYETLKFIVSVDDQLRLQSTLETIRETLNNLVASPAQPQQQSSLATALDLFSTSAEGLPQMITSSQSSAIAEMGGGEFFDPLIAQKIQDSVSRNANADSGERFGSRLN
jgi:hypothetical protein